MRKFSALENLVRVKRWAGMMTIKDESVSDHVWCMMTLAMEYIPKMNKKFNLDINLRDLIYGIAMHDIDEAITTDIPRTMKHHDKKIEDAIHNTVHNIFIEKLDPYLWDELQKVEDKSNPIGILIKILDLSQAGFKMRSEIKLGNELFVSEINNANEALDWYRYQCIDPDGKFYDVLTKDQRAGFEWLINTLLADFN